MFRDHQAHIRCSFGLEYAFAMVKQIRHDRQLARPASGFAQQRGTSAPRALSSPSTWPHAVNVFRLHALRRLIEQHQRGFFGDGAAKGQDLLFPARQCAGQLTQPFAESRKKLEKAFVTGKVAVPIVQVSGFQGLSECRRPRSPAAHNRDRSRGAHDPAAG